MRRVVPALLSILLLAEASQAQAPKLADLGRCALESGEVLEPCLLAYDTFGVRAPDGSNVVVVPTWYGGTVGSMREFIGSGRLFDTDRWFVVAFGIFGDGESTSPSNYTGDPRDFPRYGIRDLVRAQQRVLTGALGIDEAHAVAGMSMGGFQALEWAFTFPGFAGRVLPIVATPRLGSPDALFFESELRLIEACGGIECRELGTGLWTLEYLIGHTADYWTAELSRDSVGAYVAAVHEAAASYFHAADVAAQLRAMLAHDVARPFAGSIDAMRRTRSAEILFVVGPRDQMVTPANARAFAAALGVEVVEVGESCGHFVWECALEPLTRVVHDFLASPGSAATRSAGAR